MDHRIGENFYLFVELPPQTVYRVYRTHDGKYYNRAKEAFEVFSETESEHYTFETHPLENGDLGASKSLINFLKFGDYIFEFLVGTLVVKRERHTFGGYFDPVQTNVCIVYGRVLNPRGEPVTGTKIEVVLNKNGYFIDKYPLIPAASAVTDSRGSFEIPLLVGLNVTINIPEVGFTVSGYVPKSTHVEISPYCLVSK